MGRWLIITGCMFIAAGVILHYAPWLVNWCGRLPGDIRIGTGRARMFIPLTSMLMVSIILTLLINLFRRF